MSFFSWLADRLILCPSTHTIDPEDREQVFIDTPNGRVEAWILNNERAGNPETRRIVVIKFPGTAGRAERGGLHPVETWPKFTAQVWTVNHLGYGGSDGPATIKSFSTTASAVFEFLSQRHPQVPILVVGNSLGCISALYVAGKHDVAGVFLRNPPPISQMIRGRARYNWWNFGLSRLVADQVPVELDAVVNAGQSTAPCLFIQSVRDRVVPRKFQDLIINQYAGNCRVFMIPDADHHDPVGEPEQQAYFESLHWLQNEIHKNDDVG